MNNPISKNIIRFIILAIAQVFVFNNVEVFSFITPFIYILFVLLLPFNTPRWLRLISGFFMGLTIDAFSNTGGIHAASTTLIAFLTPFVQNVFGTRQDYEPNVEPNIRNFGFKWFFVYAAILTAIHHVFLFYLEIFSFSGFIPTLWYAILNSALTLSIIILFQYLFFFFNRK